MCPPGGRLIEVSYANGDRFRAEFFEAETADVLSRRYPKSRIDWVVEVPFPITVVEVWETVAGSGIQFGPNESTIRGGVITECFTSGCAVGIHVDASEEEVARLLPSAAEWPSDFA